MRSCTTVLHEITFGFVSWLQLWMKPHECDAYVGVCVCMQKAHNDRYVTDVVAF